MRTYSLSDNFVLWLFDTQSFWLKSMWYSEYIMILNISLVLVNVPLQLLWCQLRDITWKTVYKKNKKITAQFP